MVLILGLPGCHWSMRWLWVKACLRPKNKWLQAGLLFYVTLVMGYEMYLP